MSPNWNTTERGKNRENEDSEYESSDYDGKSCMDHHSLPGRGIRDVEDLTMLSGLAVASKKDGTSESSSTERNDDGLAARTESDQDNEEHSSSRPSETSSPQDNENA